MLISSILFVAGCGKKENKDEKMILETSVGIEYPVEIDSTELTAKVENKDSFVLYIYQETCTACASFNPYMNEFVYLYEAVVYKIEARANYTYLKDNVPNLKYTPTLVLYKDGEYYKKADPSTRRSVFSSENGLSEYIFTYFQIEEK